MLEDDRAPSKLPLDKDSFERASRIAVVVIGGIYILGLLVTNIALYARNVPAPDLAYPRYMIVGSLCISLLAISMVLERFARVVLGGIVTIVRRYGIIVGVGYVVVVGFSIFLFALAIATVSAFRLSLRDLWTWVIVVCLLFMSVSVEFCIQYAKEAWRLVGNREQSGDATVLPRLFALILLVVAMTYLYAMVVFPGLSSAFGGGHPHRVVLAITVAAAPELRAAGAKVSGDGLLPATDLLFEDSNSYYVAFVDDAAHKTWCIRKSSVSAAIYMPEQQMRVL